MKGLINKIRKNIKENGVDATMNQASADRLDSVSNNFLGKKPENSLK